jgi:hypothetical protein
MDMTMGTVIGLRTTIRADVRGFEHVKRLTVGTSAATAGLAMPLTHTHRDQVGRHFHESE